MTASVNRNLSIGGLKQASEPMQRCGTQNRASVAGMPGIFASPHRIPGSSSTGEPHRKVPCTSPRFLRRTVSSSPDWRRPGFFRCAAGPSWSSARRLAVAAVEQASGDQGHARPPGPDRFHEEHFLQDRDRQDDAILGLDHPEARGHR